MTECSVHTSDSETLRWRAVFFVGILPALITLWIGNRKSNALGVLASRLLPSAVAEIGNEPGEHRVGNSCGS